MFYVCTSDKSLKLLFVVIYRVIGYYFHPIQYPLESAINENGTAEMIVESTPQGCIYDYLLCIVFVSPSIRSLHCVSVYSHNNA